MTIITLWPILAAGIASVLIGWVWYHPRVFGTVWMRLANVTPEMAERGKKMMPLSVILSLCGGMLVAWIMNALGAKIGIFDWVGAVFDLALWLWLGFVVPTSLGMVLWEQRPIKLYFINAFYWLVTLVVMALILTLGSQMSDTYSYDTYDGAGGEYIAE